MTILTNNKIIKNKYIKISLNNIKGISYNTINKLCNYLRIGNKYKLININNKLLQYKNKKAIIFKHKYKIKIEDKLIQFIKNNINKYIKNKHYKGHLLKKGYPIKNQRTRSNAKTIKHLYNFYIK